VARVDLGCRFSLNCFCVDRRMRGESTTCRSHKAVGRVEVGHIGLW
jgi:hypothetical protein